MRENLDPLLEEYAASKRRVSRIAVSLALALLAVLAIAIMRKAGSPAASPCAAGPDIAALKLEHLHIHLRAHPDLATPEAMMVAYRVDALPAERSGLGFLYWWALLDVYRSAGCPAGGLRYEVRRPFRESEPQRYDPRFLTGMRELWATAGAAR